MSGTGKSEATNFLKDQFNFDLFYFGGIVLNEVKKRGLEINNENEKMVFFWTASIALRNIKY